MISLPKPTKISLSEAVRFVARQSAVSTKKAQDAIKDAGTTGSLEAFGVHPLNYHPDIAVAKKHPAFREARLEAADWAGVDWKTETSGRLSSICVNTASLESWFFAIGSASHASTPPPLSMASDELIRQQLQSLYNEPDQKPPNLVEVTPLIRDRLKELGKRATQEKIRSIAEEDEFKRHRRPAGRTVVADRNFVNLSKPQV